MVTTLTLAVRLYFCQISQVHWANLIIRIRKKEGHKMSWLQ